MVPKQQSLLAAASNGVHDGAERLQPAKHSLHPAPHCTVIQVGSKHNDL